jgi:hypothetical protein
MFKKADQPMSQQELMPEPQSSQSSFQEISKMPSQARQSSSSTEVHAQISSRPHRPKMTDLPKSDHPATFEDSLPLYSYPAQDQPMLTQQSNAEQSGRWQQQTQVQDSRIARGAYQPYSQYNAPNQVPRWTQPQNNSMDTSKWIGLVFLALVVLVSIPMLCSLGTVFVTIVLTFSLLPIILSFAPIVFFLLIPLINELSADNHDDRRRHSSGYDHSWWW